LTVEAAWAEPGRPIIPPDTPITIVPRALAFRNERRSNVLFVRLVRP
jgi:hypothetical protein